MPRLKLTSLKDLYIVKVGRIQEEARAELHRHKSMAEIRRELRLMECDAQIMMEDIDER